MADWYYQGPSGRATGPVPSDVLRDLAQAGVIRAETEVSRDGKLWVPARRVNGLVPTTPPPLVPSQPTARATIDYRCQHCGVALSADARWIGEVLNCGACKKKTVVPDRSAGPALAGLGREAPESSAPTWMVVSGVTNLLMGIVWFALFFPVGIVLLIWGVVELMRASSYSADRKRLAEKLHGHAVGEVVAGLFNWFGLLCGVMNLIEAGKLERGERR